MTEHLSRGRAMRHKMHSIHDKRAKPISAPDESGTDGGRNLSRRATSEHLTRSQEQGTRTGHYRPDNSQGTATASQRACPSTRLQPPPETDPDRGMMPTSY